MGFLTFLLFALIAFWLIGLILRASVNHWLNKRTEEYNRAAKQAQREAQRQARGKREGDVVIESTRTATEKKISRNVGDYVEFEEIIETEETVTRERKRKI